MNYILFIPVLLLVTFFIFILPIYTGRVNADEKGIAIKVYKNELKALKLKMDDNTLTKEEFIKLEEELDIKTSFAISEIESKTFKYKESFVPVAVIIVVLMLVSFLYYQKYYIKGIDRWASFQSRYSNQLEEGLFNREVLAKIPEKDLPNYCFSLHEKILENEIENIESVTNLAFCHLRVGFPTLARDAVNIGVEINKNDPDLNYLLAESTLMETKSLDEKAINSLAITLKQKPDHLNSLWLLGIYYSQRGDLEKAKFFLTELKKYTKDDPQIEKILDKITKSMSEPDTLKKDNSNTESKVITVTVRFKNDKLLSLKEQKSLYIIVKDEAGKLINVTLAKVSDFTKNIVVSVDDENPTMMKKSNMSDFKNVTITARISITGNPIARSGDFTSQPVVVDISKKTQTVNILVDRVVE